MKFSQRVKKLGHPLDQIVVIGSGLLDQLDIRKAGDIDLVVSDNLYRTLKSRLDYQAITDQRGEHLEGVSDDEIWTDWPPKSYDELMRESQVIDGVHFVSMDFLIAWKKASGREKDIRDAMSLEEYSKQYERI